MLDARYPLIAIAVIVAITTTRSTAGAGATGREWKGDNNFAMQLSTHHPRHMRSRLGGSRGRVTSKTMTTTSVVETTILRTRAHSPSPRRTRGILNSNLRGILPTAQTTVEIPPSPSDMTDRHDQLPNQIEGGGGGQTEKQGEQMVDHSAPFENVVLKTRETVQRSYERFYSAIDGGSTGWSDWVDDVSRQQLLDAMQLLTINKGSALWSWCKEAPDVMSLELLKEQGMEMRALVVPAGTKMTRHYPPGSLLLASMLSGSANVKSYITSKRQGVESARETARHSYHPESPPWMYFGGPQRVISCAKGDVALILEIVLSPPARLSPVYSEHTFGLKIFPTDNSTETLEQMFSKKDPMTNKSVGGTIGEGKGYIDGVRVAEMRQSVGGLDDALQNITRRIFATRRFPPRVVEKLGLQHVRGMLLYGPPGCGKTLLAREIGKALNAREPKIVSGPEILNKWVGEAEKSIRGLFLDAEREQREKGRDSALHVVIFDEMDAVCKVRGSVQDGGVRDSVVNQLLAKLDGIDQLNNLLVIGLTNRRELIDPALLRPGRLEVQMYVGLPNAEGRQEILDVHLGRIVRCNYTSQEVKELFMSGSIAKETNGFSGAEIAGLVRSAMSFAFTRAETGDDVCLEVSDVKRAVQEIKTHLASERHGRNGWRRRISQVIRRGDRRV